MAEPQIKSNYTPAYDGMRFFMLISVLEYHYLLERKAPIEYFWFLSLALPCFFVLSGFLITQMLLKVQDEHRGFTLLKFYARRSLRIFPAYYVVLLLAHLAVGIPYVAWHATYLVNFKVFYVSAFGTAQEINYFFVNWNTNGLHLWSMAIEEQFYLLFPPILLFAPRRWRTKMLSYTIVGCLALRIWYLFNYQNIYYGALLPISGEYIVWGCLFAWLDHQGRINFLRGNKAMLGSAIAFLFWFGLEYPFYIERYEHGVMIPSICLTGYAICIATVLLVLKHNKDAWYSKILCWKPFRVIGKISYSGYLIHMFVNPLVDKVIVVFPWLVLFEGSPRAIAGPIVTISIAALMWWTFEGRINSYKDIACAKIDKFTEVNQMSAASTDDTC